MIEIWNIGVNLCQKKFIFVNDKQVIIEHLQEVIDLLSQSYWADKRSAEAVKKSMNHSSCYGIIDTISNCLIGFGRVVTDYATMFYLTDVIIEKTYRGQGLGKAFVNYIVCEEGENELEYGILFTEDAKDFYLSLGFEVCGETGMVKRF